MMKFFRSKSNQKNTSGFYTSVGVREDSDKEYRSQRHKDLLSIPGMLSPEKLDSWVIEETLSDDERTYLPRPLWDDEALLTRDSFTTKEAAENYVKELGGNLLAVQ